MEAPHMKRGYFIGMDSHCQTCDLAAVDAAGELHQRGCVVTAIPLLVEWITAIPRPRRLVFEEGPLADWLCRNLRCHVDELVVCEPRRNRLIATEGDKDDPIDAEKLADLFRGGYVKAVHHPETLERAVFKQHVLLYQDRVGHRVAESHRACALLRRHGIMVRERHIQPDERPALLARLPDNATLRADVRLLWKAYDAAVKQEEQVRHRLVRLARGDEVVRRFQELPGIGWIRAATLLVCLDTPWRFRSKQALWKYLGIGLERCRSGNGPERLQVPEHTNRPLKSTILGAAKSAVAQGDNPFADQHRRLIDQGLSRKVARRHVARSLAATLWGLWKNGSAYRPEWVGIAAAALASGEVSS
jgi:transposase